MILKVCSQNLYVFTIAKKGKKSDIDLGEFDDDDFRGGKNKSNIKGGKKKQVVESDGSEQEESVEVQTLDIGAKGKAN